MTGRGTPLDLVRHTSGAARVTNVELFFDLVYVFAVTQLSHHLLHDPTITGALQTALLLAMVWLVWAYTAWVTNWLDPERMAGPADADRPGPGRAGDVGGAARGRSATSG